MHSSCKISIVLFIKVCYIENTQEMKGCVFMNFKKTLKIASIIFAVLAIVGIVVLAIFPEAATLVKVATTVAIFSVIGLISCVRALRGINWKAYEQENVNK
mgnify:CR=1 FL=1